MARLSATFVILSIALATRGMPSSDGYDTKSDPDGSKQQQPKVQAFWGGANCVSSCRSRWGWTGHVFGDDPWGRVLSTGDPVPTSTSSSSSAESTSSSTEAATVKIFNFPTASVPANVVPLATSSSSSTSSTSSSSTSSSSTTSSRSSSTSTSSTSQEVTVHIFNAPVNTTPPTLPTLKILADPTTTSTPEPEPTPTPTPEPEPETQAPPPPPPPPAPKPKPTPEPEPEPVVQIQSKPAPPQENDGGDVTGDRAEYLKFHNEARSQHGAQALSYSLELENFAQQWADNCVFEHSGGKFGRVGENLAAGTGVYSIEEMIGDWVVEVKDYDPGNPDPSHFTQVVWKETTQVGCAKQTCQGLLGKGPATYYVCEYLPAGNVIGNFDKNVQK